MPGRFPPPPEYSPPPGNAPGAGGPYPLDIGRIFELTFSLFRFGWRTYLAAAFLIMIPVAIVFAIAGLYTSSAARTWYEQIQDLAAGQTVTLDSSFLVVLGFGLIVGVLFAIGTFVAETAVTHAAYATYNGQPAGAGRATRFALGRLGALAAAYLVTFLASLGIVFVGVFVASLLFFATSSGGRITQGPGVFFALVIFVAALAALIFITIRWALIVPVIVIERIGGVAALRRSWRLVSGSTWRVLGYLLVFGLVFGLIAGVLTFALTIIVDPASLIPRSPGELPRSTRHGRSSSALGSSIISVLVMPFTAIGMMLLYLDLRWRRGESLTPEADASSIPPEVPDLPTG